MEFVIKETNVLGDYYKAKRGVNYLRLLKKSEILREYPIVDHVKIYCFKPKDQRGPAKESQTFIVSYAYLYDDFIGNKENELIEKLNDINLSFHKQQCIFRDKPAYKIFIMDTDVRIEDIINIICC